jgi:hypothetical protein
MQYLFPKKIQMIIFRQLRSPVYSPENSKLNDQHHHHYRARHKPPDQGKIDFYDFSWLIQGEKYQRAGNEDIACCRIEESFQILLIARLDIPGEVVNMESN